jgi:hypothetical protein
MASSSLSPEPVSPAEHATPPPEPTLDAVRRELRRSWGSSASEHWSSHRLHDELPPVALPETMEILLDRRGEPRFDAAAVAWHARLAGHAAHLTLEDSGRALTALERLGGSSPEIGASALAALCRRQGLTGTAAVLGDWLARRASAGGRRP